MAKSTSMPAEAPAKTFTPEEIERYATYHWLQVDDDAHVWRTIAGECRYLGLANKHIAACREPEHQLPLIPALTAPPEATHYANQAGTYIGDLTELPSEDPSP